MNYPRRFDVIPKRKLHNSAMRRHAIATRSFALKPLVDERFQTYELAAAGEVCLMDYFRLFKSVPTTLPTNNRRGETEKSLYFFFFLFSFQLVGSGAYPPAPSRIGGEAVGVSGLLNSGQGGSRAAIALPVDEDAAIRFQDQLVTLDLQYERKSV
jgi:hypothetical protein